jgi:hypothetical protein
MLLIANSVILKDHGWIYYQIMSISLVKLTGPITVALFKNITTNTLVM